MKIEVISGKHSRFREGRFPAAYNTIIRIDGKEIQGNLNDFWFSVRVGDIARWGLSFRHDSAKRKFWHRLHYLKWKLMRLLNIW